MENGYSAITDCYKEMGNTTLNILKIEKDLVEYCRKSNEKDDYNVVVENISKHFENTIRRVFKNIDGEYIII